ncbi:HAMP domain-containing protein [Candidatus Pacearchaeota archaeon]|nr:HAMP domain-containing protein [Candidatus Pacearchaeota archaeon]
MVKLNIRNKILIGFGIILGIALISMITVYTATTNLNKLSQELAPLSKDIGILEKQIKTNQQIEKQLELFILVKSPENKELLLQKVEESQDYLEESVNRNQKNKNILEFKDLHEKGHEQILHLIEEIESKVSTAHINLKVIESYNLIEQITNLGEQISQEKSNQYEAIIIKQKKIIKNLQTNLLISALILIISGSFLSIKISKTLTNPIIKLKDTAEKIGRGNLNILAEIKTNDEIGELANTINLMTNKLKASRKQLQDANKNLEKKIKKRIQDSELKSKEYERMNKFMLGRENVMVKLKSEIKELKEQLKK